MAEVDEILAERGKVHGPFDMHATFAQRLKDVMRYSDGNWEALDAYHAESLEMIQHKIARILAGDPNHIDHWIDICGYSQLVVNILRSQQSTQVAERRSTLQPDQP